MSLMKELLEIKETLIQVSNDFEEIINRLGQGQEEIVPSDESKGEKFTPVSFEAIQRFLAEKSREGFTQEIRELIRQFGRQKLSELDPSVYPDLWKAVEGLSDDG